MAKAFRQVEVTGTYQFTWIGSTAPSSLTAVVFTASATVVFSTPAVQSGGGNWYVFGTIPDSFGTYPAPLRVEWTATASTHAGSASLFRSNLVFEVIKTLAFYAGR